MKSLIITIALAIPLSMFGQTLERDVVSSGGDYSEAGGLSLSATVGEAVVTTETNGNLTITQGFQQSSADAVISVEPLPDDVSILIYPNPTSDVVYIDVDGSFEDEMIYRLYDELGQVIATDVLIESQEIDLQDHMSGVYFLEISSSSDGNLFDSYQIQKIN